jgi:hypothetical protein
MLWVTSNGAGRRIGATFLLVCLFVFPIAAFWLGGRVAEVRNVTRFHQAYGRLSQLRAALHNYHELHGQFPPTTYQPRPDGPVHSWRVLLMPHLDAHEAAAYKKYDFTARWNSEQNMQAVAGVSNFFNRDMDNHIAVFVAAGEDDEWPTRHPLNSLLVTKGKDKFLLVEYPDSEIHWMEPKY